MFITFDSAADFSLATSLFGEIGDPWTEIVNLANGLTSPCRHFFAVSERLT